VHQFDNTRKIMAKDSSEIAKLTERLSKDPKSKLFVPLAEEYKKIGDIEMAIHVLTEGLKVNPGYVTARSFLGRLLMEEGNFAASQKEFEEVVKAIPDNLLAQRKLGDLNLLQKRQEEALKHYKIAITLNPGDTEIAALISDLEAGVDAGAVVVQQKSRTSPDQAVSSPPPPMQSPVAAPEAPPSLSSSSPVRATAEEQKLGTSPDIVSVPGGDEPVVAKSLSAQTDESAQLSEQPPDATQQPAAPVVEQEEAEEVFAVEPLDEKAPLPATEASDIDFFSEKVFETNPTEEETGPVTASSRTVLEETVFAEAKTEEITIPDSSTAIGERPEPPPPGEERAFDQTETDDFTTDTLAELYIAQGFFEKAIDIYQRMLAENPNSRGLKDKLERVKAMAIPASEEVPTPAAEEKTTVESTKEAALFAEPKEYVPPVESQEEELTLDSELYIDPQKDLTKPHEPAKKTESDIFVEPQEYRPENKPEDWTGTSTQGTAADEIFMPPREEKARSIPQYADFEPREYIPPEAQPPVQEETARSAQKSDAAANKATIERLEHWLSNIKKER
jgi:tetratricopeptide (TPR) repeat protein